MPKSIMPEPPGPTRLLTIELVPSTSWFNNVRTAVSTADWDRCKRYVRHRSQDRCEICGGRGPKWPVECHEVWRYDLPTETQFLDDLIALCPACHEVKHIGFAEKRGRAPQAIDHLARVRGWSTDDAITYAQQCFELWSARSAYDWTVDLSFLATLGIAVPERPKAPMDKLREDYA